MLASELAGANATTLVGAACLVDDEREEGRVYVSRTVLTASSRMKVEFVVEFCRVIYSDYSIGWLFGCLVCRRDTRGMPFK